MAATLVHRPRTASQRATRQPGDETFARSALKAITYRLLIVALDFSALYLFTRRLSVAVGFTVASNVYTTLAYLVHERLWAKVTWGRAVVPGGPTH